MRGGNKYSSKHLIIFSYHKIICWYNKEESRFVEIINAKDKQSRHKETLQRKCVVHKNLKLIERNDDNKEVY